MQLQPLDEADFDRLEELLETDVFAGDAYGLDEIQAMLCAVVSGPTPVMPSVWLPEILGEPGLGAADDPRVQETIGLLMRLNNDIAAALLAGQGIAPIVYPLDEEGNAYDYATWADAYVFGTSLGEDWFDHVGKQGEALSELLEPFFLLNGMLKEDMEKSGERWFSPAEETRVLAEMSESLPIIVQSVYNFWQNRRAGPIRRSEDKVGRNDLCPCGSDKKYKQCCGRPEKLN